MATAQPTSDMATLPAGDVVKILIDQHARIKQLMQEVASSAPEHRGEAFATLRAMLAVHETAEEMIVRPVTAGSGGQQVATARNKEEGEAADVLKELEGLDPASPEFMDKFDSFKGSVMEHAGKEETDEFPILLQECGSAKRASMGRSVHSVEEIAPTRAHPSVAGSPAAQWAAIPFVGMVDRVRDALSGSGSH